MMYALPSRRHRLPARRLALGLLAVSAGWLSLALLSAAPSYADSATINVLDPAGKEDPVTGVPRTFKVSGTTAAPVRVYIKVRNPGPTPCSRTAGSDSGEWWNDYDNYDAPTANGNFSFSDVFASTLQGPSMFCIWLASNTTTEVTAITQTISFRAPNGTISGAINPLMPAPDQTATLTVTGVSEAPEYVYAKVKAAGPCAQTYLADTGWSVLSGSSVNGNFSLSGTFSEDTAGNYVACLWLAGSSSDSTPTAGPQPVPFTVGVPPAPAPAPPAISAECRTARSKQAAIAKKVTRTKRLLLRAKRRSTRRRLTRRLASQRRSLRAAIRTRNAICGR